MAYQLDFRTPGSVALLANSRKQILHNRNLRMYPRLRPQCQHLRTTRVLNFGFLFDFEICACVAIAVNKWFIVYIEFIFF